MKERIIILIGPPGSGKDTMAFKIVKKYGYATLSSSEITREISKHRKQTPNTRKVNLAFKAGDLVDQKLLEAIIFPKIKTLLKKGRQGIVLNGAMRTLASAKRYRAFLEHSGLDNDGIVILFLKTSPEISYRRLLGRWVCKSCRTSFLPKTASTGAHPHCPKCHKPLTRRKDDTPATIKHRLKTQGNHKLIPIRDYLKKYFNVRNVDSNMGPEGQWQKVLKALEY